MMMQKEKHISDDGVFSSLATAGLWGSFAQIASLMGAGAACGPALLVAGGAAASLLNFGQEAPDVGVAEFGGGGAEGISAPTFGANSTALTEFPIIRPLGTSIQVGAPEDDDSNDVWLTPRPTGDELTPTEKILSKDIVETPEGEDKYEGAMRQKIEESKSELALSKLTVEELVKSGFSKQPDGTYAKFVEKEAVDIGIDSVETTTKMITGSSRVGTFNVEVAVPKITWETKTLRIRAKLPGSVEVATSQKPVVQNRSCVSLELQRVIPAQGESKSVTAKRVERSRKTRRSRHSHGCHGSCCNVAMAAVPMVPVYTARGHCSGSGCRSNATHGHNKHHHNRSHNDYKNSTTEVVVEKYGRASTNGLASNIGSEVFSPDSQIASEVVSSPVASS